MPHLSVSYEDAIVLRQLLEAARLDLAHEIAHTDSREFRQALQNRHKAIERLLAIMEEQSDLEGAI